MISAAKTTQHSERHVEILMDSAMGKTAEYRRKTQFFSGFARRIYIQQEAIWRGGGREKRVLAAIPRFVSETMLKSAHNSKPVRSFGPTRPTFETLVQLVPHSIR